MPTPNDPIILFDIRYWQAWWKIHVEAFSADRLLDDAIRRGQYEWAAAIKRASERSARETEMSRN